MNDDKSKMVLPDFIHQYVNPETFLGEEDAMDEWQDPKKSVKLFLHTNSYEDFKKDNILYLFGRRGTGKTAIIRMLDYEINSGKLKPYICSSIIDHERAYNELASQLRGSPLVELPQNELVYFLIQKWRWILTASAMVCICKTTSEELDCKQDLHVLQQYLSKHRLYEAKMHDKSPVSRITEIIGESLSAIDYIPTKLGLAITRISDQIYGNDFTNAEDAMINILRKKKGSCIILIDSIEFYNLKDPISRAVISSLIQAIRICYSSRLDKMLLAKAAFPAEIYPYLTLVNQEKVDGRNLFILWRYRDLVCLLAKRYYRYLHEGEPEENRQCKFDGYVDSKEYIYKHLAHKVEADQGIEFDTLAYIIRHTQKKPRQVILLLNIVLTLAKKAGLDNTLISADFIKKGVHARLDILVRGVLEIYQNVYENAETIVKRVLNQAPSHFDASQLDKLIKEVSAIRTSVALEVEDVKRLLIESGSIGVSLGTHLFPDGVRKLMIVAFEYQVKGLIATSNRAYYALHPMLYQDVMVDLDLNTFVYPVPYENEESQLIEAMGIHVA